MQKINILMVDDHPENLVALEAILADLGQNLVKAHSGREALKALLDKDFALILLDVAMADMDGFETAALIRERERSRHTPIIFLTAISTSDVHVFKGYSMGAVDYLLKPLVPEILRSKVMVFVDLFRKTEEVKQQAKLLRQTNRALDKTNKEIAALYREIELKNMELQTERDFLSTVLHTCGSLVVILDRQGRIIRFNRACEQITGYAFAEVEGRPLAELFWVPEELEMNPLEWESIRADAFPVQREIRWRTKSGESRLIAWSHTALVGTDGSVEYIVGTGMDITERQRAEEERAQRIRAEAAQAEAKAAERRAAFLAEASAVLASSLDYQATLARAVRLAVPTIADWTIVYTCKSDRSFHRAEAAHADPAKEEQVRQLTGFPPKSHKETNPMAKVLQTGKPEILSEATDSLLESLAENAEHLGVLRQLDIRSMMVVPLRGRGEVFGVMGFVATTPDRRYGPTDLSLAEDLVRRAVVAAENAQLYREAAEANRAKDEFLATVSHELRTPLTAILGWARLLRTGTLDESTAGRALETIERNARAQSQLIEDILDVSRIITGKLRLELRPVELVSVMEAALDAAHPMAEAKGVQLVSSLNTSSRLISGDASRLQQVAWNLLSNAIKFTPKGGRVEVRLERRNSHAQIIVSDTGKGISPDFLPYVFERFRQADSSVSRAYGGLGLGLAIVRHLVELHGGTIQAESPGEGQGATFTVTLPLQAAQKADDSAGLQKLTGSEDSHPRTPALNGLRVLVVEDEADTREWLTTMLEQRGAVVTAVASAADALETLEHAWPDALVCDVGLPGEDGYALIRKVRLREAGQARRIPAVALTAYTRMEDRVQALMAGFQMHLAKPVEPVELATALSSLIRQNESI